MRAAFVLFINTQDINALNIGADYCTRKSMMIGFFFNLGYYWLRIHKDIVGLEFTD